MPQDLSLCVELADSVSDAADNIDGGPRHGGAGGRDAAPYEHLARCDGGRRFSLARAAHPSPRDAHALHEVSMGVSCSETRVLARLELFRKS